LRQNGNPSGRLRYTVSSNQFRCRSAIFIPQGAIDS
jgi:hypothetical protein